MTTLKSVRYLSLKYGIEPYQVPVEFPTEEAFAQEHAFTG